MQASIARHRQTGFSLPEVLVSLVLFIVIIGALTGIIRYLRKGFFISGTIGSSGVLRASRQKSTHRLYLKAGKRRG